MNYIHIAGTNAKGSVSEYIYQILMAEGYSCGIFTSPHLFSPAERFRMNGRTITEEEYQRYMKDAGGVKGEHMFRRWTRAALAWFEDNNLDFAVIEAGIGGSKDSTNVVDAKIAVLTPISLDHTKILGDTVEKIARDKCGIIKPGAAVITFGQRRSVMRIIESVCKKQGARLIVAEEPKILHAGLDGQDFAYKDITRLSISAVSPHQADDACGAIEAALAAGASAEAIKKGLANTHLEARVQVISPGLVIDGAHNPAAIGELKLALEKHFVGKKILVLTAVMRDKDANGIAAGIRKFANKVVCTCVDRERGLPAFDWAKHFDDADYFSDPRSAFAYAKVMNPEVLVVCGSFYLAGVALRLAD